jgi:hypothetical protein
VIRRLFEQAWGVASRAHCGCEATSRPGVLLFEGRTPDCARLRAPAVADLVTLTFDPDAGALWLTPAGTECTAAVSGAWRRLQILVPQALLDSVKHDVGLPDDWRVEFEPGPVATAELAERAEALAAHLHADLPVSALQLDENMLEIAFLLICHEARIVLPGIGQVPSRAASAPGDWVRTLVAAILTQARDSPGRAENLLTELVARLAGACPGRSPGTLN